jgi:hypothetical protein
MLANLYPWFLASRARLLPFGAAPMDFERLGNHVPEKPIIDFKDGLVHQVYVGRCGPDMSVALKVIFRAFKRYSQTSPEKAAKMRFHFIGTDYAPPPLGHDWALPVAGEEDVLEFVQEHRYRVPYFDSLYYLRNADALVAVGSNDPTYSASKFFSYILAKRPLLMVFHAKSPVLRFAQNLGITSSWGFSGASDIPNLSEVVYQHWYTEEGWKNPPAFSEAAFEPYTARSMVSGLAQILDGAVEEKGAKTAPY